MFNSRLTCVAIAAWALAANGATPLNISVSPNAFGAARITWPLLSGALSYVASISPFAHVYDWSTPPAAIPDPVSWTLGECVAR